MKASHELEIESRKVVRFDIVALQERFPTEWAECVEQYGDQEAIAEFAIECWSSNPDLFESTAHDSEECYVTEVGEP